ncbi:MAG: restriction endonuclease subunit S [Pontibacterium sp.]
MSFATAKLADVSPAKALKKKVVDASEITWHLNLDQVESQTGRVITEEIASVSEAGNSTHWFDERHVLYSKLRPYLNKVVVPEKEGVATTELVPMLPDPERLDRMYLAHYLRSNQFVNWVSAQVAGAKMPRVSMKVFWEHEIPLPPLDEQKRIAAILDKADALRRKRQQAIDLADQFLRSVFLDMFGDPVTNPKGWLMPPLKELSLVVTGNTPSRAAPENYGCGIEWIKSDNINTPLHYLTEAKERLSDTGLEKGRSVPCGSVLITCIAGSPQCIGNAAIANRKVAFNQQINALIPRESTTTEYLYSLALFGKKLIQGASTNSMKGMVSKGNLEQLKVPAPPLELQERYSGMFRDFLKKRRRLSDSIEHSEKLFFSLSQQAFSGQL